MAREPQIVEIFDKQVDQRDVLTAIAVEHIDYLRGYHGPMPDFILEGDTIRPFTEEDLSRVRGETADVLSP